VCLALLQITDGTFIKNFLARASPDAPSGINMGAHLSPKMQSWTSVKLWNVTCVLPYQCIALAILAIDFVCSLVVTDWIHVSITLHQAFFVGG
jgi:hypothetical protein